MILIRKAAAADADIISRFQVQMARETENIELDTRVVAKGVSAVFADPHKGCYYVAEIEGVIAGSLLTTKEWSDWRNCSMVWIQSVYVVPAYRQRGVFSRLYGHIRQRVENEPDLGGIRLYVEKANKKARSTYSRLGMVISHYRMFEWIPGN